MKNVLIVDDCADTRDMLTTALSIEGWMVQSTDSLLGALTIAEHNPEINVMLLDYNLPGMPMEDFKKRFDALSPKTGVILISAVNELAEKAQKFGYPHYLSKPIDYEQLRVLMNACLEASGKN